MKKKKMLIILVKNLKDMLKLGKGKVCFLGTNSIYLQAALDYFWSKFFQLQHLRC